MSSARSSEETDIGGPATTFQAGLKGEARSVEMAKFAFDFVEIFWPFPGRPLPRVRPAKNNAPAGLSRFRRTSSRQRSEQYCRRLPCPFRSSNTVHSGLAQCQRAPCPARTLALITAPSRRAWDLLAWWEKCRACSLLHWLPGATNAGGLFRNAEARASRSGLRHFRWWQWRQRSRLRARGATRLWLRG
jgi:hypothetical protein